jgi:subtilase family serine protease
MAPSLGGVSPTNAILHSMATTLPLISQFSSSWNTPADDNTGQALDELAAQGQSFFLASGDNGGYGSGGSPTPPSNFHAASQYLTLVGGTLLTMNGNGASYASETTWNDGSGSSAGGIMSQANGFPSNVAIPYYQGSFVTQSNGGSSQFRNAPDVSAVAQSISVVVNGKTIGQAGTSYAAPLWAAYTALINEQGRANNTPPVGFVNPALYAIASTGQYNNAFNDIKDLSNNNNQGKTVGFTAVSGYDLATGLGSPQCGIMYLLVGGAPPPIDAGGPQSISLRATETQTGPYVCIDGTGFTSGDHVSMEYFGIPGRTAPLAGGSASVQGNGAFTLGPDLTQIIVSLCSGAQLSDIVTITVTEKDSQNNIVASASATMDAGYWCANSAVSTNLNGGCP